MTPTPEGAALIAHRDAAAAELDLPVGDALVIQYGALRAAHDLCQVKIAEGALDAVPDLIRLHDAMTEIKKLVPPKPISVTLTIVRPTDASPRRSAAVSGVRRCRRCQWQPPGRDRVERCYKCGWKVGDDFAAPWQPIITGGPSPERASEVTLDVRAPAEPAANVAPLQPPRKNPGSIHDAPGARMAPSASDQVASYVGAMFVSPMSGPDWSAASVTDATARMFQVKPAVRFGSKADIREGATDVRFTPKSGH